MKRRQATIVEHETLLGLANEESLFVVFEDDDASLDLVGIRYPDLGPGSLLGLAGLVESLEAYSLVRLEVVGEVTEVNYEASALGKV